MMGNITQFFGQAWVGTLVRPIRDPCNNHNRKMIQIWRYALVSSDCHTCPAYPDIFMSNYNIWMIS